jgi:NTP pyrophosphatase (non-canonical NTP hydrolase)
MEINEYQKRAMSTCLPACENEVYMLNGLTAEVGEVNDKIAKWVRKGIARIDNNRLVFNTSDINERNAYVEELLKELGDCAWFIAGLAHVFGVDLQYVTDGNIDKLANRKKEGTIISHTDH